MLGPWVQRNVRFSKLELIKGPPKSLFVWGAICSEAGRHLPFHLRAVPFSSWARKASVHPLASFGEVCVPPIPHFLEQGECTGGMVGEERPVAEDDL